MLARARKTIKRFDFSQKHTPRSLRNKKLTPRLVYQISRTSVTQRLDLIRIRLLRSQLEELYKIKDLLEKRMIEQHEREEQQKVQHQLEREKRQKEMEEEEEKAKQRLAELERIRLEHLEQRDKLREARQEECAGARISVLEGEQTGRLEPTTTKMNADSTFTKIDSKENNENTPPPAFYTPEEEKNRKESRCCTIDEEEDDLVPSIKATPPRSYPRQSIGQWSVERAKNNMSVRSMVTSLEVKVGPKSGARSRAQK